MSSYIDQYKRLISDGKYSYAMELMDSIEPNANRYKVKSLVFTHSFNDARKFIAFCQHTNFYDRIRIVDINTGEKVFEWSSKYGADDGMDTYEEYAKKMGWPLKMNYSKKLNETQPGEAYPSHNLLFIKEDKGAWKVVNNQNNETVAMIRYAGKGMVFRDNTIDMPINSPESNTIDRFIRLLINSYKRYKRHMHLIKKPHKKYHESRFKSKRSVY